MIPLESADGGRPALVNLAQVRAVSADAKADPPELHIQFEGGSISRFRAIDEDGDSLQRGNQTTTEQQLLRNFRAAVAGYSRTRS